MIWDVIEMNSRAKVLYRQLFDTGYQSPEDYVNKVIKSFGLVNLTKCRKHSGLNMIIKHCLAYVLYREYKLSTTEVAKLLGYRDHSTIVYLLNEKMDFYIKTDPNYRLYTDQLKRMITMN